jgi:magnesium-transporting ATPase (P-type)
MMPSPTEIQQTASSAQTGQKRMRPCLKIGLLLILLSVVLFVLMFVLPAIGFDNDVFFVIALFGSLICFFVGLVMCLGKNPRN